MPEALLRPWINELNNYLPKWKRDELKAKNTAGGFEMVRTYQDANGITRVCWAYFLMGPCFA